eukprot:gene30481-35497_t
MMIATSYNNSLREKKQTSRKMHAAIILLLALGACVQSYRWYVGSEANEGSDVFRPANHKIVGRGFQRRLLEEQLIDKEQELAYLRQQIEKASLASRVQSSKAEAFDKLIQEMDQKVQAERKARNRAQLALSEKASMLQACQLQRDEVAAEVQTCGNQIIELTQARYRHT